MLNNHFFVSMFKSSANIFVSIYALSLLFSVNATADVFSAGEFRLTHAEQENSYIFTAKLPSVVMKSTALELPDYCDFQMTDNQTQANNSLLKYEFNCRESFAPDAVISTPWLLDGAIFILQINDINTRITLKRSLGTMALPLSELGNTPLTKIETIKRYFWQGILHIWFGWDHLAFVLCLCLLAKGYRLLKLVTAFTLGHSATLALSFYQVVAVPIAPIEVLIAFSIVLMAREAYLHQRKDPGVVNYSSTLATSAIVVVLFGLIHGLGFASALTELGVPENEIGLALLFFNIGVEAGQIVFILLIALLGRMSVTKKVKSYSRALSLYFVGILGAFWTIERLAGF